MNNNTINILGECFSAEEFDENSNNSFLNLSHILTLNNNYHFDSELGFPHNTDDVYHQEDSFYNFYSNVKSTSDVEKKEEEEINNIKEPELTNENNFAQEICCKDIL